MEVRFRPVEYEVVDPDSGPSESFRAEVLDVRVRRAQPTGVPSSCTS